MKPVAVQPGESPVVLGFPHGGTFVPAGIEERLNETGRGLADTDWHIHELYRGLLPGATTVQATFHRYVVDANRDPEGASLYPGQNTTGTCPTTTFDGEPIYRTGQEPSDDEIADRVSTFHAPYHAELWIQLDRIKDRHGFAILYDCHSIRSNVPFLFEGRLPDFNIGTNDGATCDGRIETAVVDACVSASGFSFVLNGRFTGGWSTRNYGRPEDGIHAIQMEMAQSTYLEAETAPWTYDRDKAAAVRRHLGHILTALAEVSP